MAAQEPLPKYLELFGIFVQWHSLLADGKEALLLVDGSQMVRGRGWQRMPPLTEQAGVHHKLEAADLEGPDRLLMDLADLTAEDVNASLLQVTICISP